MGNDTLEEGRRRHGTAPAFPANTHKHHHGILICLVLIFSIIFLLGLLIVIIVSLRRLKSTRGKAYCSNQATGGNKNPDFNIPPHTDIQFTPSPVVKGGCIQKVTLGQVPGNVRLKGVQVFTYRELEDATDRFNETNMIGNGGNGVVYRGILRDGTVAAIKMLHREGKQGDRAFKMEVDLLSRLQSPYLVELLGYCADQQHRLLVFEFMPKRSLHHQLHTTHNQRKLLDWETRLRIALDCARALEFLHERTTPSIIHHDFKCSNILLDHNLRAKVSDLGLARMGSDKINGQILTRVLGTTGYLAPEYASTGKLTTKSDVYSYGIVLLELLTGRVPINIRRPAGEHVLVSWALPRLTNRDEVEGMIDPVLEGQYSKKDLIQVAAIAAVCVQPEPDYRPLMTDIVQSLIPIVKNISPIFPSSSTKFPSPRP